MEFEDLLEQTGGFGKFQKKLTILFLIPIYCVIPWFWLNRIFILSVPQHWCNVPDLEFSNLSIEEQRTLISPPSDPSCTMYNINYTNMLLSGFIKAPEGSDITPCVTGWKYDAKDYEQTASTKWNLVCENNYLPSLIFTLSNVGNLIGTPIYGFLSDKFGRKIVFLFAASLIVVTELGCAFVNNFVVFIALRIINGSCMPTMYTLPNILVLELVAPEMRGKINVVSNTSWIIGLCILPVLAYLSRTWTNICFITAGAGSFILCYFRFIPESPSWLLSQNKYKEALAIMIKIGNVNGKSQNQTEMLFQLKSLQQRIKKKREDEKNVSQAGYFVLRYPRLRRNFLVIAFCWMAFNVASAGITYNMVNLNGNEFLNFFLLSVIEFPGIFILWYAMDRIGRRWTTSFGFFLISILCLLPLVGFSNSDILSSMVTKCIITGIFMVVDQQAVELFPTVARSFCMGTGRMMSSVVGLLVPFIAYLSIYGKAIPFTIISFICMIACIISSFLPESLNKNLPQTISDSENFGRNQKFFSLNRRSQEAGLTECRTSETEL